MTRAQACALVKFVGASSSCLFINYLRACALRTSLGNESYSEVVITSYKAALFYFKRISLSPRVEVFLIRNKNKVILFNLFITKNGIFFYLPMLSHSLFINKNNRITSVIIEITKEIGLDIAIFL